LSVARLQHALLAGPRPVVRADSESDAAIAERFGGELAPSVLEEFAQKRLSDADADALNDRLASDWDDVRAKVLDVLLPLEMIDATLRRAGAPLTPADIALERDFYEQALLHAREIRNRFTVLDLAAASGRLLPLVSSL